MLIHLLLIMLKVMGQSLMYHNGKVTVQRTLSVVIGAVKVVLFPRKIWMFINEIYTQEISIRVVFLLCLRKQLCFARKTKLLFDLFENPKSFSACCKRSPEKSRLEPQEAFLFKKTLITQVLCWNAAVFDCIKIRFSHSLKYIGGSCKIEAKR